MKNLKYVVLLLLMSGLASAQTVFLGLDDATEKKNYIITGSLLLASGFFDGTAETLKFHYYLFEKRFPNADAQFWDPSISWVNKYKNRDFSRGPKFPLSTSVLVFTTDGYHLMRFGRNTTIIAGITITLGDRKRWYQYVLDGVIKYGLYNLGFTLSYDVLFKE